MTNISHFGAFVSIGLPQEALVHISEFSDGYVADPNEAVRIGQQVTAFVLAADPTRGRISLSMKGRGRTLEVEPRAARGAGNDLTGPRPQARSRAEALAHLERLFKK